MLTTARSPITVCLALTRAISQSCAVDQIYDAALEALAQGLGVSRAAILLFDADGVMRFKAWRGLSPGYRAAVEGHTPWRPDTPDPQPVLVPDVTRDASLAPFLSAIQAEGIAAMAFIPLVSRSRVVGKFMLYDGTPRTLDDADLQLAGVIAAQVAFALERTHAEAAMRQSEERLRFALDAASMGTWDWDLASHRVHWSDNLERIHGLPPGTFDGSFESHEREVHPDDRERVLQSAQRAIREGVPHEVEYRIVAPDGTIRWVEGKGRVEFEQGTPVRMAGICMIVTRRKEAELARLAAAEEAGRVKDEFLATLSHELRTPLNAIVGWVQMLEARSLSPEQQRQAIQIISRNARLQAQLIEDILDVSRIVTGKLELDCVPLLVSQVIETSASGALPAAAAKQVEIVCETPTGLPAVMGDPARLQQVLGNVLSNAIKFTPAGGLVRVSSHADEEWVVITVRDTGAGIDSAFLPHIFERFRQADSRATRRHGGLGLGLAIARHIVEQHGGDIGATSGGAGLGTTIEIRLPVAVAGRSSATEPSRVRRPGMAPPDLSGVTVLVVDDQADSRGLLATLLEGCGATVWQESGAAAALARLAQTPVHLLVADIAMPEMDGYELMRRVRDRHGAMAAIAVSAQARPEDRHGAYAAGYQSYCSKPVDVREFLRVVREAVVRSSAALT